jgi:hypothetical protein
MNVNLLLTSVHRLRRRLAQPVAVQDERSNRGLVPEHGGVGICVRKGKHYDFETRIECAGGN